MKRPLKPNSLHWLGDRGDADKTRHAVDMTGCVMYFDRQSGCLEFMRWVEGLSSEAAMMGDPSPDRDLIEAVIACSNGQMGRDAAIEVISELDLAGFEIVQKQTRR